MKRNNGEYFERIVQVIEKSIDPKACVKHDVQLPILNSNTGRTAQCDIVITSGNEPRQTITIVEVQDRNSKVKINEFNGWLVKLENVGAQHLICVSKHEFPKSIQEVSALHGHKVRLIQLSKVPSVKIPLDIFFNDMNISLFDIVGVSDFIINLKEGKDAEMEIRKALFLDDRIDIGKRFISSAGGNLISLHQYCREHKIVQHNSTGQASIIIGGDSDPGVHFIINDRVKKGEIRFELNFESKIVKIPINILTYQQSGNTLAWLAEASHDLPQGKVGFKFGVTPTDKGYEITILHNALNMPPDSTFTIEAN